MQKKVINITKEKEVVNKRIRVAIYVRVSVEKESMLHSYKAQIDYYKNYVMGNPDYEFVGIFSDYAKTGTKESREEFQELISKCKNGEVDRIITKSISRFARNTVTLLKVVRELKEIGVDVFFEEQNMHSLSEEGELMLTLLAGVAQEESLSCSEAVKWRIRRMFESGESTYFRMLGYELINKEIVVVPEEAELVKRIYSMYLGGLGIQKIANTLFNEGITTETIKVWSKSTIREILTNEKYKGDLKLQKTYTNNHISKKKMINDGVLPQYYVSDNHEGIISKDIWETVNKKIRKKKESITRNKPTKSVFTSKIKCSNCDSNYKRKVVHGVVKWCCSTYDSKGKKYCASKAIREDILKNACNVALSIKEFDEDKFIRQIEHIEVRESNILIFYFHNGEIKEVKWTDYSRRDSWSIAMKDEARRRAINYGRQSY